MRVFPFLSYLNKYSVAEKNELKSLNDEASSLFIWMNYFNPD
jgi:hypothetical protein